MNNIKINFCDGCKYCKYESDTNTYVCVAKQQCKDNENYEEWK